MTAEEPITNAPSKTVHKRKFAMITLGVLFTSVGLLWLIYWFFWGQYHEYTDDAYVNGNMVQLMPQVPGTVIQVNTDDTQLVNAGQPIIQLDPADYAIALQNAKAELAQTVRQVNQYFADAQKAQQNVNMDKANLLKAELDVKRRNGLVGTKAVSREDMQHYQTTLDAAKANYNASINQLDAAMALVTGSDLYSHPLVEQAKSNLKKAYLNFKRTTVVAPVTGYVAKRTVHPGQQVSPASAMLAIIPLNDTWVDANYKESSLQNLRVHQPVTLYADAYPDVTYHGTVMGLNAGTGSVFSLLPPQNATGNWIKIVQRLPVRIRINPEDLKQNPLQLGLSMRVTVNTHDRNGHRMVQVANSALKYETTVYAKQLAEVQQLIQQILEANSKNLSLSQESQ